MNYRHWTWTKRSFKQVCSVKFAKLGLFLLRKGSISNSGIKATQHITNCTAKHLEGNKWQLASEVWTATWQLQGCKHWKQLNHFSSSPAQAASSSYCQLKNDTVQENNTRRHQLIPECTSEGLEKKGSWKKNLQNAQKAQRTLTSVVVASLYSSVQFIEQQTPCRNKLLFTNPVKSVGRILKKHV